MDGTGIDILRDPTAEAAVLSCMLMDQAIARQCAQTLIPSDFAQANYRAVFRAIRQLVQADTVVDVVSVHSALQADGSIPDPQRLLIDLSTALSTTVGLDGYIKILRDKTYRRKAVVAAQKIRDAATDPNPDKLPEVMAATSTIHQAAEPLKPVTAALADAIAAVSENMRTGRKYTGLRTGFKRLDMATGGLQPGNLIVLAARPSMGKTALALDLLRNSAVELARAHKIGVFFSLEMSERDLSLRLLSAEMGIPGTRFRFGSLTTEDIAYMESHIDAFEHKLENLYICEDMGTDVQDIFTQCHSLEAANNRKIGLIVIDYLQLIQTRNDNRNQEIAAVSRATKRLAKMFDCPVVVLSQLNRSVEARPDKRPMLSDLRDSGAIEQDADLVLFLYRDEYYHPDTEKRGMAEVLIAKQRSGSVGGFPLRFRPEIASFQDFEQRGDA